MSVFRRRKSGFYLPPVSPPVIREVVTNEVVENGCTLMRESVVTRSDKEWFDTHPIPTENYSIDEQVRAGVPLKDIPCGTMLDSDDNLDYEQNEYAEQQILEQLTKEDNKE